MMKAKSGRTRRELNNRQRRRYKDRQLLGKRRVRHAEKRTEKQRQS